MPTVFADAGHWIALLYPRDQLHEQAKMLAERHISDSIVTTEMALVEALNHLSGRGQTFRLLAVQMVRELENNPNVEVVSQTRAQFQAAVARYASRPDQTWGLTDCASFLVMEEYGITEALAHDQDFEQAGFVALLRRGQR